MKKRVVPNKEKPQGFKYTPASKLKGAFGRRTKTIEFIDPDLGESYHIEVKVLWPADIRMLMIKTYGQEGCKALDSNGDPGQMTQEQKMDLIKTFGVETEEEFLELTEKHKVNICAHALVDEELKDEDLLLNHMDPKFINAVMNVALGKDLEVDSEEENAVDAFPEVDPAAGE